MPSGPVPLLRWESARFSVSLDRINHKLGELVSDVDEVEQLLLLGAGDHLRFTATVRYKGMRAPLVLEARETRLRHRRVGFRIVHLRTMAHVAVPLMVVERALERLLGSRQQFDRDTRIVVIDLREWLPLELELSVAEVRVRGRYVVFELEPGRLWDIPGRHERAASRADSKTVDSSEVETSAASPAGVDDDDSGLPETSSDFTAPSA